MPSISVSNLKKSFGDNHIVKGVSLDIVDGEFLVLVGPSGCGKSTLLRMIAGLESITDGEVVMDDEVINKLPPRERDIAMVFQSYALYPHMTVRKNMAFALKLAKVDQKEIDQKVEYAASILDLTHLLDRKPAQLSGGQRQRVAMGRAIVRNPKLFLFDEPLSNLDAKLRVQMRGEIKALHQNLNTTTIYVTHDQVEAMTMADRIVVLNGGVIEQIGTPMDLYDKPETLFVAQFIGSPSMNLIEGKVKRGSDKPVFFSKDGLKFSLDGINVDVAEDQEVVLGVRPEHITIVEDKISFGEAEISLTEPTGSETMLWLNNNCESLIVIDRSRKQFRQGQKLPLYGNPCDVHLFDKNTGKRIQTTVLLDTREENIVNLVEA